MYPLKYVAVVLLVIFVSSPGCTIKPIHDDNPQFLDLKDYDGSDSHKRRI